MESVKRTFVKKKKKKMLLKRGIEYCWIELKMDIRWEKLKQELLLKYVN